MLKIEARIADGRAALATLAGTSFPALALLYAALFAAFGTVSPFMPSFLAGRGLDPQAISAVFTSGTLARIAAAPLIGTLADRFGSRLMLAFAVVGAGTIGLFYLPAAGLLALVAVSTAHASALAGLNPLADALALSGSARERGYAYGAVRGTGSAAYVVATIGSGWLVAKTGLSSIVMVSSIFFLAMLPTIPRLPPVVASAGAQQTVGGRWRLVEALKPPTFRAALVTAAMVIGSQSMGDTFAVIHWRAAGLSAPTISLLLAGAVCSEIAVFVLIGPPLVRRLGPAGCAAMSAMAGALRWFVFAETTAVAALSVSELLQGMTFALMHLAVMAVIAAHVPPRLAATAQTLYGTLCLGLASAAVTAFSGVAYAHFGGHAFLFMSGLCILALLPGRMMGESAQ